MAFTFTTLKTAIQDYLQTTESSFVSNLPTFVTQAEDGIRARSPSRGLGDVYKRQFLLRPLL